MPRAGGDEFRVQNVRRGDRSQPRLLAMPSLPRSISRHVDRHESNRGSGAASAQLALARHSRLRSAAPVRNGVDVAPPVDVVEGALLDPVFDRNSAAGGVARRAAELHEVRPILFRSSGTPLWKSRRESFHDDRSLQKECMAPGATLPSSTNLIAMPVSRAPPHDRFIWRDIALRAGFGIPMIAEEDHEATRREPFASLTRNAPVSAQDLRLASKGARRRRTGAGWRTHAWY
jgi:hypothetical protein